MLDMGFIPDVETIVSRLPRNRQTLFFSATMAPEIKRLADAFLDTPREISVAPPASPALTVTQKLVPVRPADKREALRSLLRSETVNNAILFCNRKRDVDVLYKSLSRHGLNAAALHGDLPQHVRTETLEKFKSGEIKLLVASDVAARGLDIVNVSHVFNFDVPIHAEDYVHRIGRTGRAGRSGTAFTLASSGDKKFLDAIEKLIGRPIPRVTVDDMPPLDLDAPPSEEEAVEQRSSRGGRSGRDGSKSRGGDARRSRAPREAEVQPVEVHPEELVAAERPAPRRERRPEPERRPQQAEPRLVHVNPRPQEDRRPHDERRRPREVEPESPLAFGDHVPAFMLRSLPIRKAS
jgi:superfamily II DNA/RNA helicase